MTVWKGGRGVKAPYETTHVRIPVEIKEQVEALSEAYKSGKLQTAFNPLSKDDSIELARQVLKRKKSAKLSMESLLTGIYGEKISL